jgi:hypothetical protein
MQQIPELSIDMALPMFNKAVRKNPHSPVFCMPAQFAQIMLQSAVTLQSVLSNHAQIRTVLSNLGIALHCTLGEFCMLLAVNDGYDGSKVVNDLR